MLLMALRRITEARGGFAKVARAAGINVKACIAAARRGAIPGCPRSSPSCTRSD